MRKSTASHFTAAGGNATELLDHSSVRVTKKYLDKRIVGEQSAADLLKVPNAAIRFCNRSKPADPRPAPNQPGDKKVGGTPEDRRKRPPKAG
jgi:hypothetical protein